MTNDLLQLKRNDEDGAIAYVKEALERGTWKPYRSEMLIMLQDDPESFEKKLDALDKAEGGKVFVEEDG